MEKNKTDMGADDTDMTLNTHMAHIKYLHHLKKICTRTIRDLIQIMWEVFHCAQHLKCSLREQSANLSGHTRKYF